MKLVWISSSEEQSDAEKLAQQVLETLADEMIGSLFQSRLLKHSATPSEHTHTHRHTTHTQNRNEEEGEAKKTTKQDNKTAPEIPPKNKKKRT